MYYLIRILSTSGLRISEAILLTYDNLFIEEFEDKKYYFVKVLSGKGGKTGKRLLTKKLYDELMYFKKKYKSADNDIIFKIKVPENKDIKNLGYYQLSKSRMSGRQLYYQTRQAQIVRYSLLKLGKIIKLYDNKNTLTPHMFRHAVGMILYKKGMPLDKIQQVLDHNSIATTQIYAHADKKEIARDFTKLMK